MYDSRYWLWLSLIFETGSPMCDSLLHGFNHSPKAIYEADKTSLIPFCKNELIISKLLDKRLDRVYSVLDFCQKENIGILTPESRIFPSSLLKIPSQPLILYYKGRFPDFSRSFGVAVVGTRSVTPYGSSAAYTVSHDLASAGAIVVSGMALGADTAAHRGALDAGGHTVAFLGCGIDIIYPKDNAKLMQEIISTGTVITEYAPGLKPEGRHFPVRNRLISGVSNAVLVIEAAEKSGALITASHGLKQGKLIYAVPGKVGELSSTGTNLLIQNGAKMVTSAKDIISDFSGLYEFRLKENTKNQRYTENSSNKIKFNGSSTTSYDFITNINKGNANNLNADVNLNVNYRNNDQLGAVLNTDNRNGNVFSAPLNRDNANSFSFNKNISNGSENSSGIGANNFNKDVVRENSFEINAFEKLASAQKTERLIAAQPRPTILYNGMTEDETAASYMSMETEIFSTRGEKFQNTERVYITYPKEPMPKDGYTVTLTEEGLRNFENQNEVNFKSIFSESDSTFPITPYKIENDPIKDALSNKSSKKKRISFKRVKPEHRAQSPDYLSSNQKGDASILGKNTGDKNAGAGITKTAPDSKKSETKNDLGLKEQPKKTEISFEGLNELERTVLKFISERKNVGIDGMSSLNIPVSKLLATVTMLEIKQKIIQKPGGYFEIK